jgi:hypothetical protein
VRSLVRGTVAKRLVVASALYGSAQFHLDRLAALSLDACGSHSEFTN